MLTLRVEPVVVDFLQLAGLFHSCVLVVDNVDQIFVVANDA